MFRGDFFSLDVFLPGSHYRLEFSLTGTQHMYSLSIDNSFAFQECKYMVFNHIKLLHPS